MDATEMVILRGVHDRKSLREIAEDAMISHEGVSKKLEAIQLNNPEYLTKLDKGKARNWVLTDAGKNYLQANGMLPTTIFE